MAGGKGKKRQSRLAFAPIEEAALRRGSDSSPTSSAFTPSKLRYANPFSGKVTVKGQLQLDDYSRSWNKTRPDDKTLVGAGQPAFDEKLKSSSGRNNSRLSNSPLTTTREDSSSDEIDVFRPSKRRRIQTIELSDSESDQGIISSLRSQNDTICQSKMEYKAKEPKAKAIPLGRSGRLQTSSLPDNTPRSRKIDFSELGEAEGDSSDQLASTPTTHRKRRGRPPKPKALPVVDDDDDDDDEEKEEEKEKEEEEEESDVFMLPRKPKKLKIGTASPKFEQVAPHITNDKEDSSDDDIVAFTPSRRASRKINKVSGTDDDYNEDREIPKTPTKLLSGQEELDIEEDLEDLRDTDLRDKRTRGAIVNSARSARQKHLETLRRRRAGEKPATDPEDSAENEYDYEKETHTNAVSNILNSIGFFRGRENDDDGDSDVPVEIEDLDTDDSSFVDKDGELGAPVNVPFEFSRHRVKSVKDCFRDVIEWMVHSKLNPAFHRHDEMYEFAFRKVADEVVGRVGSQLVSTVWNADFRNALVARPYLEVMGHPTSDFHSCEACNRSGHPASSDLKFSGKPYSDETLEPLYDSDDDSDSDSDDVNEDDRKRDRDREGRLLPPEDKHFYLGRTCKSNAVLSHTLLHWRFHLYEWVVDYLNRKEEFLTSPQRSLEREKLSAKKRTKYANKVVDRMKSSGEVKRLWRDFNQNIRFAREMKDDDSRSFYNHA